jgi:hypothetical protein
VQIVKGAVLLALAVAVVAGSAIGQDASATRQAKTSSAAAAAADGVPESPSETPKPEQLPAAKKKPFRGRLPAYYGRVVDERQRKLIYDIQRDFAPRIELLQEQLAALVAERDEKVAGVLTPEQRQKVEQLQAEARAKRARGTTANQEAP